MHRIDVDSDIADILNLIQPEDSLADDISNEDFLPSERKLQSVTLATFLYNSGKAKQLVDVHITMKKWRC